MLVSVGVMSCHKMGSGELQNSAVTSQYFGGILIKWAFLSHCCVCSWWCIPDKSQYVWAHQENGQLSEKPVTLMQSAKVLTQKPPIQDVHSQIGPP